MINSIKARTPILALILFVVAVGYTFAATNRVVVIPLGADATDPVVIQNLKDRITELENAQSFSVYAGGDQDMDTPNIGSIRTVSLIAPTDGVVIVNSTVSVWAPTNPADGAVCAISLSSSSFDSGYDQHWDGGGAGSATHGQLAGTRGFPVTAGQTYHYYLVCQFSGEFANPPHIRDSSLTAIFTPTAVTRL